MQVLHRPSKTSRSMTCSDVIRRAVPPEGPPATSPGSLAPDPHFGIEGTASLLLRALGPTAPLAACLSHRILRHSPGGALDNLV